LKHDLSISREEKGHACVGQLICDDLLTDQVLLLLIVLDDLQNVDRSVSRHNCRRCIVSIFSETAVAAVPITRIANCDKNSRSGDSWWS
jgi:hypothetical protein